MSCRCFAPMSNGQPSGSVPAPDVLRGRFAEIDFRAQTLGPLANGLRNWTTTSGLTIPSTVANVANASVFEIEAGGLHFVASAASTGFSTTVTDASHFYTQFSELYDALDVDASWDLLVRIYAPLVSIVDNVAVSGGGLGLSVWGLAGQPNGSTTRMFGIRRSHSSNVDTLLQIGAASSYNTAVEPLDVFGIANAPGAVDAIAGNWNPNADPDPSWATARTPVEVSAIASASNLTSGTRHADFNRVALSFGSGNALGTMDVTIERMRFDFVPRVAIAA